MSDQDYSRRETLSGSAGCKARRPSQWTSEYQPRARPGPGKGWKHGKLRSYGRAKCVVCRRGFERRTHNADTCGQPDCLKADRAFYEAARRRHNKGG